MDARRAEVRALEAEIAALQRACSELPAPWEGTARDRKSFQETYQSDTKKCESSKDLKSQLGHLKSELSFLSTLTGFNIRNYAKQTEDLTTTEMTEKGIKKVLQRHRLSGNCHMVTFQLEFQILEIQAKENLSSVITELNIIMEPTEYLELSEFVSRAEEKRDLFMFFRSLHFFVEWYKCRKRTFKHFKPHNNFIDPCCHLYPLKIRKQDPRGPRGDDLPWTRNGTGFPAQSPAFLFVY
uniref:centromere protein P isoform X2 n=1 Tax=Ictidomys tridecemlineatus TaxID=43179 RepID=UPI001A9D02B7|nr:centromere protein P isoform X2 [Ictidomys tridecemlineatus]